jgi:hypothetical protein
MSVSGDSLTRHIIEHSILGVTSGSGSGAGDSSFNLQIYDEGSFVTSGIDSLNFIGSSVTVTSSGINTANITISTPEASEIRLSNLLDSPTYPTIQDVHNIFHSAGRTTGGLITDGGSNTVNMSAGTGYIRIIDDALTDLLPFNFDAETGLSVPNNTTRYVGIEYNGGSPQAVVKTTNTWDYNTEFPLAIVVNEDGILHIGNVPHNVADHPSLMIQRIYNTNRIQRDSIFGGLLLSETGTRNVTLSTGKLWDKLNEYTIPSIDTSASDTFDAYYRDGLGGFTKVTGITQWPNTEYDDGSGVLQPVPNNRFASLWFYIELEGEMIMIYGQTVSPNLAQAGEETPPINLPDRLTKVGTLLGRIIFQGSAATSSKIQSAFEENFIFTTITDHGELLGLVDDDHILYALADGTRGFSGTVSGVDPVDPDDLSTKYYVDTVSGVLQGQIDSIAPGGLDTELQYNNAGSFGGMSGVTWNSGTATLDIDSSSILTSPGTGASSMKLGSAADSPGSNGLAIGNSADSGTGSNSMAIGNTATVTDGRNNSTSVGYNASCTWQESVSLGTNAITGAWAVAVGYNAGSSGGHSATAIGHSATAAQESFAGGREANAAGTDSVVIGYQASSTQSNSVAIGSGVTVTASGAVCIGVSSSAAAANNVAIGFGSNAASSGTVSLGRQSDATGTDSTAIGAGAQALNTRANAFGETATASGVDSVAIGSQAVAGHSSSVALGYQATVSKSNQFMIGTAANYLDIYSHGYFAIRELSSPPVAGIADFGQLYAKNTSGSLYWMTVSGVEYELSTSGGGGTPGGSDTELQYNNAGSFGGMTNVTFDGIDVTVANGTNLIPLGSGADSTEIGSTAVASGDRSISIGLSADATTTGSIAIGDNAQATTAAGAVAIGDGAQATGATSGAIAIGNGAVASNWRSIAIGESTSSTNQESVIIGHNSSSTGLRATIVGEGITANFNRVTAIGHGAACGADDATALGEGASASASGAVSIRGQAQTSSSVAIGTGTIVSGTSGVAIGSSSTVASSDAFALGNACTVNASANNAIAIGRGAIITAGHSNSMAFGRFAVTEQAGEIVFGSTTQPLTQLRFVQEAQGQTTKFKTAQAIVSPASSPVASGLIPAGAILIGLTCRVNITLTTVSGFDIGDGGDQDRWGANISPTAGTTSDNTDWTVSGLDCFISGSDVRLTPVNGTFDGGTVRLTAHYIDIVAPTS